MGVLQYRMAEYSTMIAGALAIALLSGLYLMLVDAPQPAAGLRPERAVAYALEHELTKNGNVINDYNYGGYLISRGIPTFIDGRGVVFGDLMGPFMFPNAASWEAMCDKYHVTWALIASRSGRAVALQFSPRWKQVYADDIATIFERVPQDPLP